MTRSHLPDPLDDDHHHGLVRDMQRWVEIAHRRRFLRLLGVGGLWTIGACVLDDGETDDETDSEAMTDDGATGSAACTDGPIPSETAGPYPGDGSNGPNALALSGIVRSDIRSSLGDATGVAQGIALTVTLTVVDTEDDCAPLEGYAVYLWHCDREGNYSMYSAAAADENYLRGVQETDANGQVTFTTIFPACYAGRMPHIHFEIYESLDAATSASAVVRTSQLAFPEEVCDAVYATSGYEQSVSNFAAISFASDNVFSDGVDQQLADVSGSPDAGQAASLVVPI